MKDLCLQIATHWQAELAAAAGPLPQGLAFLVTASQQLILLACLVVPTLLMLEARRHGPAHRRVFLVLSLLVGCVGMAPFLATLPAESGGAWSGGLVLFGAAVVAWGASLALLRFLPTLPCVRDIEDRVEELERLRRLEAAIAGTGDGVLIGYSTHANDPRPGILYTNAAFAKMTGYEPQSTAAEGSSFLGETGVLDAVAAALELCLPTRVEMPGRRKDACHGWAEWHIVPLLSRDSSRREWIAILRDTTSRRPSPHHPHDSRADAVVADNLPCTDTIDGARDEGTQSDGQKRYPIRPLLGVKRS